MSELWRLQEGDVLFVQGSAKNMYEISMRYGVLSCSCPAWINTCKHIKDNIDFSCVDVRQEKIDWDSLPPVTTDSGLYRIVCNVNGRFYIGKTDSFERRWGEHRWSLERGTTPRPYFYRGLWRHHNVELQEDYTLLGEKSFDFKPYRDVFDRAERSTAESLDIRTHLGPTCYNKLTKSPSGFGKKAEAEARRLGRERDEKDYKETLDLAQRSGMDLMAAGILRLRDSIRASIDEVIVDL